MLDIAFSLFVVVWFQFGLVYYGDLLLEAKKLSRDLICHEIDNGHLDHLHLDMEHSDLTCSTLALVTNEVFLEEKALLKKDIIGVVNTLQIVLIISWLNFLLPANLFRE